jgi:glycine/D-amino acid oxidase-like deaminating enzyme
MSDLPVVVVGAGPLGLAAAAHLLEQGLQPLVLEAGDGAAAAVEQWAHVRTFSPWPELVDPAAARLLEPTGWTEREDGYPTGREWIDLYLAPLADVLGAQVLYDSVSSQSPGEVVTGWSVPAAPSSRSSCTSPSPTERSAGWRPAR